MKATLLLTLATFSLLAMSSCRKEGDAVPLNDVLTGRLLKVESTIDSKGLNPRPRWRVDISPLSLEGNWPGHSYTQAKAYNLPDTTYKAGQVISFRYQVVPVAQQTPWKTLFEWDNTRAVPSGAEPLAEITCSDVQLITSAIH